MDKSGCSALCLQNLTLPVMLKNKFKKITKEAFYDYIAICLNFMTSKHLNYLLPLLIITKTTDGLGHFF